MSARIAIIFDDHRRPDTTGVYCRRALQNLVQDGLIQQVDHIFPDHAKKLKSGQYDLFLWIDDGHQYDIPEHLKPNAIWVIDTHIKPEWSIQEARKFELVFAAQRDGCVQLRDSGIKGAEWLPLACDPVIHAHVTHQKQFDFSFIGSLGSPKRAHDLEMLRNHFPNHFVGNRFFRKMSETYSASKIVFNRSIKNDVNMRVFEALASRSLLLTNDLSGNGFSELFQDGIHLATYNSPQDLLEKMTWYLNNEEIREEIAQTGCDLVLSCHTYRHRMLSILQKASLIELEYQQEVEEGAKKIEFNDRPVERGLTSIIIITFNALKFTRMCLNSIREHTTEPIEIIVVDNCSTDGTLSYLRNQSDLRLIENSENRGFPAAVNQGMAIAKGTQVVLLNNDVVVTPEWLGNMLSVLAYDSRIGLVGPCTNKTAGPQRVQAKYNVQEVKHFAREWASMYAGQIQHVPEIMGFCMLIDRKVISSIGQFDEGFGVGYYEDNDFCMRAKRAGYRAVIAKDSFVHHFANQSFLEARIDQRKLQERNRVRFLKKSAPSLETAPSQNPGLTSIIIVTYNQLEYTTKCLDSIRYLTGSPYEIIVVDNGSSDKTVDYLENQPDLSIILNQENRGFPAAVNQGLQIAKGENLLLLNNDVIVTTGWLECQLKLLHWKPEIGLVGPCSNYVSGPQQIPTTYTNLHDLETFVEQWTSEHHGVAEETDRLVGFCLLFKREVMDRIGMLDDRFGIGCFEDDDFCRRAIQAGFQCMIARDAFVHHFGSRSFKGNNQDFGKILNTNRQKYLEKWSNTEAMISKGSESYRRERPAFIAHVTDDGLRLVKNNIQLSACLIVRDNEKTIRDCLESLVPWMDEIVVVDTGSHDATPAIAKELGARVYHWAWQDDFAAARNQSLRHARGEWIFWMDSDDTLPEHCGQRLREMAAASLPDKILGYVVQVHCPGGDDGSEITVVDHVKLIRNRPDLQFEFRIHEQIIPAIRRAGGEVGWTDLYVIHSGSDRTQSGRARKLERDFQLLHLELKDRPGHSFVLFNLGMTYADAKQYSEAIDYLKQCLEVSSAQESHLRKAYALLAGALYQTEAFQEAEQYCSEGLELFPQDKELLFRKAMINQVGGELEDAASLYERILSEKVDRHFTSVDQGIDGFKTRHNLALIYHELGRLDEAELQWNFALSEQSTYTPAWRALGEMLLHQGLTEKIERHRELLSTRADMKLEYALFQAQLFEINSEFTKAIDCLKEHLQSFPVSDELLNELCRLLFTYGPSHESIEYLKRLRDLQPGNPSVHHNLGLKLYEAGFWDEANRSMERSLVLRPGHAKTMHDHQSMGVVIQESQK